MKLATRDNGTRDGELILVNRAMTHFLPATAVASTLQSALDDWDELERPLRELAHTLEVAPELGDTLLGVRLRAPLPRAYEWVDGSAYVTHVELVRKARGAKPPETLHTDPLVYQGGSGIFLGHNDDIVLNNENWGLDFEAEICAILGDTPQGTTKDNGLGHVKLLLLCNDITLRNLIPTELKKGFGFFNSKPATAFSPFAITPDELGPAWSEGRVHLNLNSWLNGEQVGSPNAGPEMHFSFADLIEHICKTRSFVAGTILGSGTVSNQDPKVGYSCIAEQRMREIIQTGTAVTPFLKEGDEIAIDMSAKDGNSIFGTIRQRVVTA